jgi:hypothetical protein
VPALQLAFVAALTSALPATWRIEQETAPEWLVRPGRAELGGAWELASSVYGELTGLVLPDDMPLRERRRLDVVVTDEHGQRRVLEIDEKQHFSGPRALTFAVYDQVLVAYDFDAWRTRAEQRAGREPGGGFARPCPPLFPGDGGRHRQRAFRDLLADVIPPLNGWQPTCRVSDDDVKLVLKAADPITFALALFRAKTES